MAVSFNKGLAWKLVMLPGGTTVSDEIESRKIRKNSGRIRERTHENKPVNTQSCYDLGMRDGLGLSKGYHNHYSNAAKSKAYDDGFFTGAKIKMDKRTNGK